jgi:Rad3-related DNA helicase
MQAGRQQARNQQAGNQQAERQQEPSTNRKQNRRSKQSAAVAKKGNEEVAYFQNCVKEAARGGATAASKSEADLFSKQGSRGINFDTYDKIEVTCQGPGAQDVAPLALFQDLNLSPVLHANVARMHYQRPTPIQRHAVPLAMHGCDLMCCAQTGSGKTAAFLLPVVAKLLSGGCAKGNGASPRCVVLAPTRELASQIELEAEKLCYSSGLGCVAVHPLTHTHTHTHTHTLRHRHRHTHRHRHYTACNIHSHRRCTVVQTRSASCET